MPTRSVQDLPLFRASSLPTPESADGPRPTLLPRRTATQGAPLPHARKRARAGRYSLPLRSCGAAWGRAGRTHSREWGASLVCCLQAQVRTLPIHRVLGTRGKEVWWVKVGCQECRVQVTLDRTYATGTVVKPLSKR